jgi:hypothetical protein
MTEKVRVEMCRHYTWNKKPVCHKGRKAGIKCHSERLDCSDYEASWGYQPQVSTEKGGK